MDLNLFYKINKRRYLSIQEINTINVNGIGGGKKKSINDIIDYAKSLIGTPYVWWAEGDKIGKDAPFYHGIGKLPTIAYIKKYGTNCGGFINLVARFAGKKSHAGTGGWYDFLKKRKVLKKFNPNKEYPVGTLLVRGFTCEADQGQVGIVLDKTYIIHSYVNRSKITKGKLSPGVAIQKMSISHHWKKDGLYKYYCLPEDWLY